MAELNEQLVDPAQVAQEYAKNLTAARKALEANGGDVNSLPREMRFWLLDNFEGPLETLGAVPTANPIDGTPPLPGPITIQDVRNEGSLNTSLGTGTRGLDNIDPITGAETAVDSTLNPAVNLLLNQPAGNPFLTQQPQAILPPPSVANAPPAATNATAVADPGLPGPRTAPNRLLLQQNSIDRTSGSAETGITRAPARRGRDTHGFTNQGSIVSAAAKGIIADEDSVLNVGERNPNDTDTFEVDEFVLSKPGSIVAPRFKGEEVTMENATHAFEEMLKFGHRKEKKEIRGAQEGDPQVFTGTNLLASMLDALSANAGLGAAIPQNQISLFEQLGIVAPNAFGLTDPKDFRDALAAALAPGGGGVQTLGARNLGLQGELGRGGLANQAANTAVQRELGQGRLRLDANLGSRQLGINDRAQGLREQEVRTGRELRGLRPVAGAGQIPATSATGL